MALFYSHARAVTAATHATVRISRQRNFRFAAGANAIPLGADEIRVAQANYPIVFAGAPDPAPVIVTAARDGENRFVDGDGAWRRNTYIPAYVRRYPFGLARVEGRDQLLLAVDDGAEALAGDDGEPLFENGQPSNATTRALQFCAAFERQSQLAREFAAALQAADLLVAARAELRRPNAEASYRFGGFRIVDEARFDRLSPETFAAWRDTGWIALVYAHLMSLRHWAALADTEPSAPA